MPYATALTLTADRALDPTQQHSTWTGRPAYAQRRRPTPPPPPPGPPPPRTHSQEAFLAQLRPITTHTTPPHTFSDQHAQAYRAHTPGPPAAQTNIYYIDNIFYIDNINAVSSIFGRIIVAASIILGRIIYPRPHH